VRKLLPVLLIAVAACSSAARDGATTAPGQGALTIEVIPNPIVARHVSGDRYDFPFEVFVRETGGRPVTVTRVTATVRGPGGFAVGGDSWDADRIRALGFSTTVNANGELRYRFSPREEVPDERLFGSVSAELRVDAVDDTGRETSASTSVTVRRG
jgi:hypothetical protein